MHPVGAGDGGRVVASPQHSAGDPARRGIFLGSGTKGPVRSSTETSVLVLGPPRSGKTSAIVVPSVLDALGAVVSTSTKTDVLFATARSRGSKGRCFAYDPGGVLEIPPGIEPVRWSPVASCLEWDRSLLMARSMVRTSLCCRAPQGAMTPALDHWTQRAQDLLAPILHAAALSESDMATVVAWIDRGESARALEILSDAGAEVAGDLLSGIVRTDQREQSGIWSTASSTLSAYRSTAAMNTTFSPNFDPIGFCSSKDTLYVCSTARHQDLTAPLVVGLIEEIRAAVYEQRQAHQQAVLLALDEVANIAPIPDLPSIVSEGGGQGLVTLACLQDLSQARHRWGPRADGFLSLFGITMVLPGIADVHTLRTVSELAGDEEVQVMSLSAPLRGPPVSWSRAFLRRLLNGPGSRRVVPSPSYTLSSTWRPRLGIDQAARGMQGGALVLDEQKQFGFVILTPWFSHEPWRSMVVGDRSVQVELLDSSRDKSRPRRRARDELAQARCIREAPELGL